MVKPSFFFAAFRKRVMVYIIKAALFRKSLKCGTEFRAVSFINCNIADNKSFNFFYKA